MAELIYFLTTFIQPILLFTPEAATIAAGNLALGAEKAFFIGYAGILSGILVMYAIGRFGREKIIARLVKPEKLEQFSNYDVKNETLFLGALFIFPVLPDNVICAGAGIAKLSFRTFFLVAAVTKLLTTLVYAYSLDLLDLIPDERVPHFAAKVGIIALVLVLQYVYRRYRRRGGKDA